MYVSRIHPAGYRHSPQRRRMIATFHFAVYVAISCVGYEMARCSAFRRMQSALTEKEAANEQLQQASKAKERFIANTSHGSHPRS